MIGFLAKRRSGKDTASDYLVKKFGYTKRGFAYPLKESVQKMFMFNNEQLYTEKKEIIDPNWGVKPRKVLQFIGTDIVRNLFCKSLLPDIENNFWIKSGDIWYNNNKEVHNGKVVWCDVRFQNEVDYIQSKNGIVIKIERTLECDEDSLHESELDIDKITNYNYKIENNDTINKFYHDIDILINKIENNDTID
jgi:hypothetical protein